MAPSAWFTHESQGRGSLWTAGVSVERAEAVTRMAGETPTIVLVHGAWADATGFDAEIRALRERGFTVIDRKSVM